ncbi:MAG: radical SAM family heme chaperone HemW [Planctomycetota bacterium]
MSYPCPAVYVHVPFCGRRCGYCDFYSQVLDSSRVPALVDALLAEHDRHAGGCATDGGVPGGLPLETLYVGGGTPTVLPPAELHRLLHGLLSRRRAAPNAEITVEANPTTVTDEIASVLAAAGVTRVSIGAQSFDPAELRMLDRDHQPQDVAQTVATCRRHGLRHISLDLIFGVPGQTPASWRATLRVALALEPEHISCYGLTYEPGTPLERRRQAGLVQPLDPDVEATLYEMAMDVLPAAGLHQYEISNFARPGAECRHNLRYWRNEPVLGIGPAAAGYLDGVRYKNVADTEGYVRAIQSGGWPRAEVERLPPDRQAGETAMLALRLTAGIDRATFRQRFGDDPAARYAAVVERHVADGLLTVDEGGIRLTRAGRRLADTVMADFV